MTHLTQTLTDHISWISLNCPEKNNAFDERLIQALTEALHQAIENENVRVIVLKGEGKHFSAGADLNWMLRLAQASLEENEKDALKLAKLLQVLYTCPKPTIAQIQGCAYGGGVGLVAACDISIAAETAKFCFSEVKLGLIPAVISPYVIEAIGARTAKRLFMTGETFTAEEALKFNLIHQLVNPSELDACVQQAALHLTTLPVEAVQACKSLVQTVSHQPIDAQLMTLTAQLIAKKRQSPEAQTHMETFLTSQRKS
jgi:methylglutaconyl-CoA hydratase